MKRKRINFYCKPGKLSTVNKQNLIDDLIRVSKLLNKDTLSTIEYKNHGNYSVQKFIIKFGKWNNALEEAGLNLKYNIKISDEELFNNLNNLWNIYGRKPFTRELVQPLSKYLYTNYKSRFGSWNNVITEFNKYMEKIKEKEPVHDKIIYSEPFRISTIYNQDMIDDLISVSKIINKDSVTINEYIKHGKYSFTTYFDKFGSWNNALEEAGLSINNRISISDKEFFNNLMNIINETGKFPLSIDCRKPLSKISIIKYYYRFGSWNNVITELKKYMEKINNNKSGNEKK